MPAAFNHHFQKGIMEDLESLSEERDIPTNTPHRSLTCDVCQCHTAPAEFINPAYSDVSTDSLCSQSFSAGVAVGRRLQRDQDRLVLYRYQDLVRKVKRKHEGEVLLRERYHLEAEILQQEVSEMEDRLLAMQIAYEELAVAVTESTLLPNSSRNSSRHAGNSEVMRDTNIPLDRIERHQRSDDDISFSTDSTISSYNSDDFDNVQQLQVMEELEP